MVIHFKKKIFLSFGRKQTLETIWRMGKQIDQHWDKLKQRQLALRSLHDVIEFLSSHEDPYLIEFYQKLAPLLPIDGPEKLQAYMMTIEREVQKDLKDPDFLVSTSDLDVKKSENSIPVVLVLDNLRSTYNVGGLIRTAEAIGIEHVYFCGLTGTPDNSKVTRTSLGTDNWIEWSYFESTTECIKELKKDGYTIYTLETEDSAKSLEQITAPDKSAIILGNERYGVSEQVLKLSDQLIKIPLRGRKNSLNVGVCGGIVLQHFSTFFPM